MKNRIDSLQWLRAIAAFWVLFTHVFQRLGLQPFGYTLSGQWGVDIFFILSGFVIFYTTKEGSSWVLFAKKRIFRIFPLYLICLCVYFLFYHSTEGIELTPLEWLQNILMMPFSDAIGYHSLVVGQAWSTCYELYFYALLGILLLLKISKNYLLPILITLMVAGFIFAHNETVTNLGFGRYVISLIGARHIIMFCIGIILSVFYQKNAPPLLSEMLDKSLLMGKIVRLSCKPFIFTSMTFIYLMSLLSSYNFISSLILSTMAFSLYLFGGSLCVKTRWLNKSMIYLGDISFSVYLVHSLIIRGCMVIGCDNIVTLLSMTLIMTTLVSSLTYYAIEQPFVKLAKSKKIL